MSVKSPGKVASELGLQPRFLGARLHCIITELCRAHKGSGVLQCKGKREHKLIRRLFKFFSSLSRSSFLKWSWSSCSVYSWQHFSFSFKS